MATLYDLLYRPDIDRCLLLEATVYNPNKTYLAKTDISFSSVDNSINSTTTDLSVYQKYDQIKVRGSTANSGVFFTVVSSTATKVIVSSALTTEAAGPSIKLWALQVERYTDCGDGYHTQSWENPANAEYEPRLEKPASMELSLFPSSEDEPGQSESSTGEVVLKNADGLLDKYIYQDWGFDGRLLVIKIGQPTDFYADFYTLNTFIVEQVVAQENTIVLRIRSRDSFFDKPIQTNLYAGTNSGASGVEGLPGDIKGKPKPLAYGYLPHIDLIPANSTANKWQAHDGAMKAFTTVYESGVSVGKTDSLSTGITTLTSTPVGVITAEIFGDCPYERVGDTDISVSSVDQSFNSAGNNFTNFAVGMAVKVSGFSTAANNSYFYITSKTASKITVSGSALVTEAAGAAITITGYVDTAPTIIQRLAVRGGLVWPTDFNVTNWLTLTASKKQVVGVYITDEQDFTDTMTELAKSIGCNWGFNSAGLLDLLFFDDPSTYGNPIATYTDSEIQDVQLEEVGGQTLGLPVSQVVVYYSKNYRPMQNGELAGSVTQARRSYVAEQWRSVAYPSTPDQDVLDAHPNAQKLIVYTLLTVEADALAEATRLKTLYSGVKNIYRIDLASPGVEVDMNKLVQVQSIGFNMESGKNLIVIGIDTDSDDNKSAIRGFG